MDEIPADLRYTTDHEWLRVEGSEAVVGITEFAQNALGDVVFVELPPVGRTVTRGQTFGVVESNKSVSDLFAPIGGQVVAVNEALRDDPQLVNQEPYGAGWMIRITPSAPQEAAALLDAAAYRRHVEAEQGK